MTERVLIYTPYERFWHWAQAAGIMMLVLTGAVIHWPGSIGVLPFSLAVSIHNVLGFLLLINAFLGLFYYVATGAIRQYLPEPHDFVSLGAAQLMYYMRGIFRGDPHPLEKTSRRRLNPLQQITYLVILNVLMPLQLITGLLMWSGQMQPGILSWVGGLPLVAAVHTLGAWAFVTFTIMHIYLTTTGRTPLSNLIAMITGFETLPKSRPEAANQESTSQSTPNSINEVVT
ncbi:Quinone-reactive Ni/Fe-hydrogenase B-type cytochrome subunit [Planctomycetes bacterium CA13]|uniref:Quinone-reactive Ni/Fe-hydrogenase B-type cytochrome subunit n=1 Tax=Novipirellula herctigrandis TaxID=2527986 RepID=A0A5C5ZC73_9BACT|nr:Quinone-reactive Ni/Fe-hydrogenase B-type cytochrome subunit [Planctomycetes bacterium CA13]